MHVVKDSVESYRAIWLMGVGEGEGCDKVKVVTVGILYSTIDMEVKLIGLNSACKADRKGGPQSYRIMISICKPLRPLD